MCSSLINTISVFSFSYLFIDLFFKYLFNLLFADQADVTTFAVNNAHVTTTVNESDSISVSCTASGRPTAAIVLTRNGETVSSRPKGEVTRDDMATLTSGMSRARCEDGGHYMCQVYNDVGQPDVHSITVFVNCKWLCQVINVLQPFLKMKINHKAHARTAHNSFLQKKKQTN